MAEEKKFDKQIAKEGFQVANAKYMGYAEEPKEGKKGDKAWRKAKTRWLIDGRQNENKFILWSPITSEKSTYKDDKALKQFSRYKIVWVEEEKSYDNKEWVEKRIVVINEASEDVDEAKTEQGTAQSTPTSSSKPDLSNFDVFKAKYLELMKTAEIKPNPIHMLGSFISSNETERVKELKAKCIEAIQ